MKRILSVFFFFMFAVTINSYTTYAKGAVKSMPPVTVTGQVKDAQGQPMVGVNVKVKGTTTGAQTDVNGKFQLQAPNDATLVFSFLGYAEQSVPLNGQTVLNIKLKENAIALQEVVAVGYGTQKRSEVTGTIRSLFAKEIANRPIT